MEHINIDLQENFLTGLVADTTVDKSSAEGIFSSVGSACSENLYDKVLLIFYNSVINIRSMDVYRLGFFAPRYKLSGKRLAILMDEEKTDDEQNIYESSFANGRVSCKVFTNRDAALNWLLVH